MRKRGFSLIELLVYASILAVIAGVSVTILLTVVQIGTNQSASAEVTNQVNFAMQTIQRLIRASSNIEISAGTSVSTLKLRMSNSSKDPTCISLTSGVIKLAEGPDGVSPQNCTSTTSDLTNSRVVVNSLSFKKFTQYPGHDTVSIEITMTYNSQNPKERVSRTLSSAVSRASAATFDSDVVPGGSFNFNLGQAGSPWQRIIVSDGTAANPSYTFSNSTGLGLFRAGADILGIATGGIERLRINASGNISIATTTASSKLYVDGSLTVTGVKNFEEDYPGDPSKKIFYASLEGPEVGTYIRGMSSCKAYETEIVLPPHFTLVTASSGLTAQLTPRFSQNSLFIQELTSSKIKVGCSAPGEFDYFIQGIRKGYESYDVIRQK